MMKYQEILMGNGDSDATATFGTAGSLSLSEDDDDDDYYYYNDDSDVEAALEKEVIELQEPRTFMMHVSECLKKCCPPVHLAPMWCQWTFLCVIPIILPYLMILGSLMHDCIYFLVHLCLFMYSAFWYGCAHRSIAALLQSHVPFHSQRQRNNIPSVQKMETKNRMKEQS
jgi:hypothetical protein